VAVNAGGAPEQQVGLPGPQQLLGSNQGGCTGAPAATAAVGDDEWCGSRLGGAELIRGRSSVVVSGRRLRGSLLLLLVLKI